MENRSIKTDLEAWLALLSFENPGRALELSVYNPKFKAMYQELYDISRNMERVMHVFSKELAILDRNTVRYMMDEMQSEIDQLKEEREQLEGATEHLKEEAEHLKEKTEHLKEENSRKDSTIQKQEELIQKLQQELAALRK